MSIKAVAPFARQTNPEFGYAAKGLFYVYKEIVKHIFTFLDGASTVTAFYTSREFQPLITLGALISKREFYTEIARHGYKDLVKWALEQNCGWSIRASTEAGKAGRVEFVAFANMTGVLNSHKASWGAGCYNRTDVLDWLENKGILNAESALEGAAQGKHWVLFDELVQPLIEDGTSVPSGVEEELVQQGNLELIQQLNEEEIWNDCYFVRNAIECNQIELLRWGLTEGGYRQDDQWDEWVELAAQKGNLQALQLFNQEEIEIPSEAVNLAAEEGHWEIVRYLTGLGIHGDVRVAAAAASQNREEILLFLTHNRYIFDATVPLAAAKKGHWELAFKLISHGCPLDEELFFYAAFQNRLDMIEKIQSLLPKSAYTCEGAAAAGNLELLQKLRENGYPWDEEAATQAARGGHLKVLQWLVEQECPYEEEQLYTKAMEGEHSEIVLWLLSWAKSNKQEVSAFLAKIGQGDLLKRIVDQGCPVTIAAAEAAANAGHWAIVFWLLPFVNNKYGSLEITAAQQGNREVLLTLMENGTRASLTRVVNILADAGYWELLYKLVELYGSNYSFGDLSREGYHPNFWPHRYQA